MKLTKLLNINFIAIFGCFVITSCEKEAEGSHALESKSIVILHDNDVHCSVDGYIHFAGFRDAILNADTSWVATVSSGDFVQGGAFGSISKGEYIIDIMKSVGYDAITLGNHEFDYGVPTLLKLMDKMGTTSVTCSNFINTNTNELYFSPYIIVKMGTKHVAFVGVVTPSAMSSESYAFYDSVGQKLPYDLQTDKIIHCIQSSTNEARDRGANYVILLSHLGEIGSEYISSVYAIQQTRGIDAVLDGHTHSLIIENWIRNIDGDSVLLTQTGTKFSHFGKLTISKNGKFHAECIPDSILKGYTNEKVKVTYDSIISLVGEKMKTKVAYTNYSLIIGNEEKGRLIRKEETNLGDLVTDALRKIGGTRIAFTNGGGIRKSILPGDITYKDIYDVLPFRNQLCTFCVTGQQLLDVLETASCFCPLEYGEFLHVSGLKYNVDTSIQNSIVVNPDHSITVKGNRKVKNVKILKSDDQEEKDYVDINSFETYTASSTNYILENILAYPSLSNSERIKNNIMEEGDALVEYLKFLNGEVPERYSNPYGENRIIIENK